jgi:hypothetical protein
MRMRHHQLASVFVALALCACSGPEQAPAPDVPVPVPATVPSSAASVAPALDLAGAWTVAEIGASGPEPGTTVIEVTITIDRIRAQSQCKHFWWTYTLAGEAIETTREPYPDAICERTDSYWERFFVEAVERANSAVRQPDGAVLLTGPGGQVLLRRKA